jgi:luciferase family oxidoreductase group 1
MRVGSGGIMLPNHAPLVVAEAFGTLAELYPGRIDLGLGRAPGTDQLTMRALRRDRVETEEDFPRDVAELQHLLGPAEPGQRLVAMPGAGTNVPIWLLGTVCGLLVGGYGLNLVWLGKILQMATKPHEKKASADKGGPSRNEKRAVARDEAKRKSREGGEAKKAA